MKVWVLLYSDKRDTDIRELWKIFDSEKKANEYKKLAEPEEPHKKFYVEEWDIN